MTVGAANFQPMLGALHTASAPLAAYSRHTPHLSPVWGICVSAACVGLSHTFEPMLPPRTVDAFRWTFPQVVEGAPHERL